MTELERVRRERDDLRQILDSLCGLVCVMDVTGVMQEVNKRPLELMAVTREMVIGRHFSEVGWVDPESVEEVLVAIEAAARGETVRRDVVRVFPTVGRRIVDTVFRPWRDEAGNVDRVIAFGVDVSERKQVDEQLQASEERLRLSLSAAGQGLYDLDLVTGVARTSPEYARMLGHDPDDFAETNTKWLERMHPEDRRRAEAAFFDYVQGRTDHYEVEFRQQTAAGDWLWILSKGSIVRFDEAGRPLRMLGTHTNIDVRKRAEQELRRSERRLREAQRIAMVGNWTLDWATSELEWSEEVYRIFEVDRETFAASYETFLERVHPDDRRAVDTAYKNSVATRVPYGITHRLLMPDGRIKFVREQGETRYDQAGSPVQSAGTVQDITARMQADEQVAALLAQLAHASRLGTLGEISAGLAHELNQPLTALRLYSAAALAAAGDACAQSLRDCLVRIDEQAGRAGEIISRMRAFAGRGEQQRRSLDVNLLVTDVVAILDHELRQGQVGLDVSLGQDLPRIEADAIQIQQVMVNLIRNGIEAMSEVVGGERRLTIRTGVEAREVAVRIQDTGIGLTPEVAAQMFAPFQTTKATGLGLGLVICRNIAEAHGGRITLEPGPHRGTTACLTIPIAASHDVG